MITLKQIEAVYWVSTLGSFRSAAEKLNTTQSAVSKRVNDIESALSLQIFNKKNRTQLTIAGRELLTDFSDMLELRQRIISRFQDPLSYTGYFRLGVTEVVALNWLPSLISSIKQRYPKMILESNVDMAQNLLRKMESNLLDVAILPCITRVPDPMVSSYLTSVDCDWMISKNLLPDNIPIDIETIFEYPLLMHSEGSILYDELRRMLKRYRIEAKEKIYCGSMMALAELASNSLGIAYLPSSTVIPFHEQVKHLRTIDLPFKIAPLKFYAVHSNDSLSSDVVSTIRPAFM